ncbi:DUF3422 domain-containing protein [Rhizobium leguminosarum]|uniref:DUF3422 domain-containing protein n=1 Tax=Rhizobium leguminosarum TaxID=384 RepID=UPI001C94C45F|nr:DUF3422 domain-containing protein [Rhizobium leguminosarum]MBY5705757.1 DUF3422 domain-containing protein [Rhizobium leguminosarum]
MSSPTDELHARPTIYFDGPAYIEHVALMPDRLPKAYAAHTAFEIGGERQEWPRIQVEFHTEFVTVTKISKLATDPGDWPLSDLPVSAAEDFAGIGQSKLICRTAIMVRGPVTSLSEVMRDLGFGNAAASVVGEGAAQICSDFLVSGEHTSRILLLNADLNKFRLGRMVRRLFEIEACRAMALLGLTEARRLAPMLGHYDSMLVGLSNRNITTPVAHHKELLEEISALSARVISATAETRNRFSATSAYSRIVEDRISELRERHVPGFQRFGMFVTRRFQPAVRTCEATAHRLVQLSAATGHLLDLLQTRIQVEIEFQNAGQIQAVADRAATQVKIQRAVEGFSIIAISYYLLSLMRFAVETLDRAGYHVDDTITLGAIPVVVGTVAISILRVKRALAETD